MSQYREKVLNAMLCMTRQCWEQGIVAQTLMELGEQEKLRLVVHDMVLRQSEDGRLCNVENTPAITDSSFCIPATYLLGKREHNPFYLNAAVKNVEFLLKEAEGAEDGTLFHMIHTTDIWADSAAFLPYSLALTGHPIEAIGQLKGICRRLYHKGTGLYFHMWNEEQHQYSRPLPWGVGNGWILTGILRLLLVLKNMVKDSAGEFSYDPKAENQDLFAKEIIELRQQFQTLLDIMLTYKTENHLFHDILNNPDSFEESECSAMVAYAIYTGVKAGLLKDNYLKEADLIREAIYKKVTDKGLVLDSTGSPSFDRAGTAVECQAHFLMMEDVYRKL